MYAGQKTSNDIVYLHKYSIKQYKTKTGLSKLYCLVVSISLVNQESLGVGNIIYPHLVQLL